MTDPACPSVPGTPAPSPDSEINLLEYARIVWKRRNLVGLIIAAIVILTALYSLFIPNVYQAKALIIPVSAKDGGAGGGAMVALAAQFGAMPGLPGIALPGASSAAEIVNLLKSNILRQKLVEQHQLLPVLFPERWDDKRNTWKTGGFSITVNPFSYLSAWFSSAPTQKKKAPNGEPDTWAALRKLEGIIRISQDIKQNTIIITVDYHDPELAARIADAYLATLINHMSSEAKRVANTNRKYLEEQLGATADPFIKQKTYNLIAQQIETAMMAEVKENFAFKVIDPPRVPDQKIKPKRSQMVILSFFVALFLGILTALSLEWYEKRRGRPVRIPFIAIS